MHHAYISKYINISIKIESSYIKIRGLVHINISIKTESSYIKTRGTGVGGSPQPDLCSLAVQYPLGDV